jgi:hypothetical protein
MNKLPDVEPLDYAAVEAEVTARDREVANRFSKDGQITAIRAARGYLGDRLGRVVAPHRLTDPKAGPMIAVKLHILTRKTLGGIETDLQARVLKADGTPLTGLYAAGEVAGFGGGGVHGYRALEGTFLGGCIFSGRAAGRGAADDITASRRRIARCGLKSCDSASARAKRRIALEGDRAFLGQHLEVGAGHLGESTVIDASRVRSDDPLVDRYRARRCHRAQVIDGLGNPHPRGRRRGGQYVHRLAGHEQRVAGMHQPGGVDPVADQVRNVLYDRDFRVDNGVPAADGPHGQLPDLQLVADVHRPARRPQLGGGLRIGV